MCTGVQQSWGLKLPGRSDSRVICCFAAVAAAVALKPYTPRGGGSGLRSAATPLCPTRQRNRKPRRFFHGICGNPTATCSRSGQGQQASACLLVLGLRVLGLIPSTAPKPLLSFAALSGCLLHCLVLGRTSVVLWMLGGVGVEVNPSPWLIEPLVD